MRRVSDEAHGVSVREQQIIDGLEAGKPVDTVASELGVAKSYVRWVEHSYVQIGESLSRFERMVRSGDAAYRAALAASGGRYR